VRRQRPPHCLECREASTGRCHRHAGIPLIEAGVAICPRCGGRLDVISAPDGYVIDLVVPADRAGAGGLVERPRLAPFVGCTVCEFCAEVRL